MHTSGRTMSSQEFSEATTTAKAAAVDGPVFVTDEGCFSHVLLSYDHYRLLAESTRTLADVIGRTPEAGRVELEAPRCRSVVRAPTFE